MRTHGLNRWNWSDKAQKWVYVYLKDGKRVYKYQKTPPHSFDELTRKIKKLNRDLMEESDPERNADIYEKMMALSEQLQGMKH